MTIRAIVSRLDPDTPTLPKTQYLHRTEALFASEEWSWKDEREGAWCDEHSRVETQAQQLRAQRGWKCWVLICGDPEAEEVRRLKHLGDEIPQRPAAPVLPEPEYEETGRPPIRRQKTIAERIEHGRRCARARRTVTPQEAYEMQEKRGLA